MAKSVELDEYDRKILRALQENADYSMADLGNMIGLSHTPCWRRLKRLEVEGVIRGKVTLLDPKLLNLGVTVHAYITIKNHDAPSLEAFEEMCRQYRKWSSASQPAVKKIMYCEW